ncbi:hypothetical protein [Melghirimyces profundicolus]|uniref:hypothetical protein n=1 Tax=Melghirimyces profundicolus TaxID=1242148 RepID=UPI0011B1F8C5|nr:hypothetical protein [Melghirimyces profundicolus]
MKRTGVTLFLGMIVTLTGLLFLFTREKTVSELRGRQAWGFGIFGFGLAHIVLGGLAAVMGRKC